jgi:ribosomal protein L29
MGKAEMLKTETLKAERAIANSNQTGKAPNRLDEVKRRIARLTP